MSTPPDKLSIFWFRRDLRLHDNVGLYRALKSGFPVLPLFIFDRAILEALDDRHDRRIVFIHRALDEMQSVLRDAGATLVVRHGDPETVWRELLASHDVAAVFTNGDYEPYARERDGRVHAILAEHNIPFYTYKDQVIFEKNEITTAQERPYTVYTPYRKRWESALTPEHLRAANSEGLMRHFRKADPEPLPTLEQLGFEPVDMDFPPREIREGIVRRYHETRDYPAEENGTTRLGVHLRFGTVSVREAVRAALDLNDTWLGELIWREFFMMILWNTPRVVEEPFREKYAAIPWRHDDGDFQRWCEGRTGYPIVDAGMRELNATGYMHNRVRMITASFLTKHLLIDWRWGERYFARHLLDYELASNNGNWQWAAGCGCDAAPYFRIFNPTTQMEKFDPDGEYVRRWVPEVDGDGYPEPMVAHKAARERALEVFKAALADDGGAG